MVKHAEKTYVITSAQAIQSEKHADKYGYDSTKGAPNLELIESLEAFCEHNEGELNILSMVGMSLDETKLDKFFDDKKVLYKMKDKNCALNHNIRISDMVEPPQNIQIPTTRDRFIQRDQSVIMAHSKQSLRCVPASNCDFPKLLVTTGSCTHPNYNINRESSAGNRRADIAYRDHKYGAVVVEIIDDTSYNVRHLPAQKNGVFVDMGLKYDGKKSSKKIGIEALVLGDLHVGDTDKETMQANYEMIDYFKPKRLFIHDLVNAYSVNHHEADDRILRAIKAQRGELNLKEELEKCYLELKELSKAMGKREINIVSSNHDNFIYRYLSKRDFADDSHNAKLAAELFAKALEYEDAAEAANKIVEIGIKKIGKLPPNIHFLPLEQDYRVWGYQLASHGHMGHSGGRGSTKTQELCHGKSITGHAHSPEILRDAIVVGTSTKLDLAYTRGQGSKWLAANAVLYEGGFVQLISIINGKWRGKNR
jgi:hypothetical protein